MADGVRGGSRRQRLKETLTGTGDLSITEALNPGDSIRQAFRRTLVTMIIYELVSSLAIMIDGIILAHFYDTNAVAAHGLTAPFLQMTKFLSAFFAGGCQIVCSSLIGRSRTRDANRTFTVTAMATAALSLVLSAVFLIWAEPIALALGADKDPALLEPAADYLRGLAIGLPFRLGCMLLIPIAVLNGREKLVSLTANIMIAVDVAGDLLNVLVLKWGMFGLALATSFCDLCAFVPLALSLLRRNGVRLTRRGLRPGLLREVAGAGFLPCFTRSFSLIRSVLLLAIYVRLADTMTLAANSLVQGSIKILFVCVATAIGQTVLTMSGFLYNERDKRSLIRLFRMTLAVSFGPCAALTGATILLARPIVSLFGAEPALVDLAAQSLRIFMLGLPFLGLKFFYIYYFQSSRNRGLSMLSSVLGECVFICVLSFALWHLFGTLGLWIAYPLSEVLYLAAICIAAWRKYGHIPRRVEEFLFLDPDFDVADEDKLDLIAHSREEVLSFSPLAYDFCMAHGVPERDSMLVSLSVEEMCRNIYDHGMKKKGFRRHYVDVKIIIEGEDEILIRIRDDCPRFDPVERAKLVHDPDDPSSGIGLRLVYGMATELSYTNVLNLNNLFIRIGRRPAEETPAG